MPRNPALLIRLAGVGALATGAMCLTACDRNDGPAESTGRAVDNAADNAADALDDAADSLDDAADNLTRP